MTDDHLNFLNMVFVENTVSKRTWRNHQGDKLKGAN